MEKSPLSAELISARLSCKAASAAGDEGRMGEEMPMLELILWARWVPTEGGELASTGPRPDS